MIRFILLVISTLATVLFLFGLMKGKNMDSYVSGLDDSEYFLKDLYVVGFALNETKLFRLRGDVAAELKKNTKLIVDNVYAEYYAYLAWAQFLTLALLALSIGMALCSMLKGAGALMIAFVVVLMIAAVWDLSMSKMKDAVHARTEACLQEFPNMVSKLSLLLTSGMVLREAWYVVANGKDGPLYDLMKKACNEMDNGDPEWRAIQKFGVLCDTPEIRKFTSTMLQSAEKGNSELSSFLISQITELWAHKRQLALQKGEVAAGKLIIPLGLMFGGIILIIVAGVMQSMNF